MPVFKKHLTPISKGGAVHKHEGKGSQMAALPDRRAITALAQAPGAGLNDFSKATPMANPAPTPPVPPGSFPGGM